MISIVVGIILCFVGFWVLVFGLVWFFPVLIKPFLSRSEYLEVSSLTISLTELPNLAAAIMLASGVVFISLGINLFLGY